MGDLRGFREAVRASRRAAGRSQQQLARSIGLHPDVLSHKLNGRDNAILTAVDVIGIVTTLAAWGALVTTADACAMLELMAVPPHAIPATAWAAPPLAGLRPAGHAASARLAAPGLGAIPGLSAPAGAAPAGNAGQWYQVAPAPLPAPATPLIGREGERAEVAAAVAASRLVTLTGAGGSGKTRLALQAASELAGHFADGVAFADLGPVSDPALLGIAIARALGLAPPSAGAAEGHVTGALQDKELLLVLDNLEQLLEEAPLLGRMLAAAPALRMLATSRIPLRLYGEHVVRVPPLRLPGDDTAGARDSEAVRLFTARARAVRPGFAPRAAELAAIGAICTALDGLPLAIELAAARIRLYSPQALLPLLASPLALLTGGPRDLPHRQQTLRAALDWSHRLLPPGQRHLFACLGVLAGPFGAAAAAAVSGEHDPARTLERLAELADHSLLEVTPGPTPGFQMLQTVREYALARLAEAGQLNDARHRHLAHYLALAAEARAGLAGPGQAAWLDQLEAAYPNIRSALEFACHQARQHGTCLNEGLRLAAAASPLWRRRGPLAEGTLHLGRLLALDDARHHAASLQTRASAVLEACALACLAGDYPRTTELARQAIALCEPLGDHQGLARAHRLLGKAATAAGDGCQAEPPLAQAPVEARDAGGLCGHAAACSAGSPKPTPGSSLPVPGARWALTRPCPARDRGCRGTASPWRQPACTRSTAAFSIVASSSSTESAAWPRGTKLSSLVTREIRPR